MGHGWSLAPHVFPRHVKVTFFAGRSLEPAPPESGKDPNERWINIREGEFDEEQMEQWIRQAAAIPGWDGFQHT